MKGYFFTLLLSAISLHSMTVEASGLRLGVPAYGGTGCPAGSASVSVAPDEKSVSILFDSYVAEAGYTTNRSVDRKSCNITVPVQVPQGYSVSIFQVDYRGFNAIPSGATTRFDAEYFWAGSRGPRLTKTFFGPRNDNYTLTDQLVANTVVWAPCGASVNLRVNTSMMAQTNSRFDQTMGTVDSADISSGLVYHLRWRRCN
jgi:hypothetical protein